MSETKRELTDGNESGLIHRQTLHEQVASRIRDMIIEGHLAPDQRINEAVLVQTLGVSRTPLREALRTLAGEGLIDIRPARGSVVKRLSPQDVISMLEVLAELEKLAGRLACERASDEELAELLAIHDAMIVLYKQRERLQYYKLNQAIHSGIARISRNNMLIDVQATIQSRLKRIRFLGNQGQRAWADAVSEHEEMAEALRRRDGARLGEVLARHLMNTWDRVKSVV